MEEERVAEKKVELEDICSTDLYMCNSFNNLSCSVYVYIFQTY